MTIDIDKLKKALRLYKTGGIFIYEGIITEYSVMIVEAGGAYLDAQRDPAVTSDDRALEAFSDLEKELALGRDELGQLEFKLDVESALACVYPTLKRNALAAPIQLDPDMPADQLRLHFGELTADEVRLVRVAMRFGQGGKSDKRVVTPSGVTVEMARDALINFEECADHWSVGNDQRLEVKTQLTIRALLAERAGRQD